MQTLHLHTVSRKPHIYQCLHNETIKQVLWLTTGVPEELGPTLLRCKMFETLACVGAFSMRKLFACACF